MENHNENREIAIQMTGVKKRYKLGQIGGGTLQADLQSWWARIRGKEDPNVPIGQKQRLVGQTFMALNGIDLTVYKGEALGIIGANGAGKSTMLKLLSRVTAPTEGEIDIYGRIASMLEVGTGFNGEMTGRENIYMNGAILGMTKAEIDDKMEQIIDFSEVREFIDTPVKRYSSGMYVKLAFSVAAHLDSEIMIMDEVLAVGDVAFQTKCLDKMREAAQKEGRTVLYVSHNMNTIRHLCERCIVLDKGRIIFDGDVEEAIGVYVANKKNDATQMSFENTPCPRWIVLQKIKLRSAEYVEKDSIVFSDDEPAQLRLKWKNLSDVSNVGLRIEIWNMEGKTVSSYILHDFYSGKQGSFEEIVLSLDLRGLMDSSYQMLYTFYQADSGGNSVEIEAAFGLFFDLMGRTSNQLRWKTSNWGYIRMLDPVVLEKPKNNLHVPSES